MQSLRADSCLVSRIAPSPNFGERAQGASIDAIVLHYTGLREEACEAWTADPGGEALAWLCNPEAQVSSHYLVHEDGRIVQLVAEDKRAWHAGRGIWKDCTDINSCSVGIEIANTGHAGGLPPYPGAQVDAVVALCRDIAMRRGILPERILAHSDIAPDRKADPGEHFPWTELAREGIGLWTTPVQMREGVALAPGDSGDEVLALQRDLQRLGFGLTPSGAYDKLTEQTVRAFQRHWRPASCDGIADVSTRETLARLLAVPAHSAAVRDSASGS